MKKSYEVRMNSLDNRADVFSTHNDMKLGFVRKTNEREPSWVCADSEGVYLSIAGKTAEQAAYKLVEYLNQRREHKTK